LPNSSLSVGGDYASLEPRRQQLVDDWTKRFTAVTGQHLARVFSLSSVPNALADAAECAARAQGSSIPDPLPLDYGQAYEMTFRFDTGSGDAPVLRLLWRKEMDSWRITSYRSSFPERNRHRPCPFVSRNVERTKAPSASSRVLTT